MANWNLCRKGDWEPLNGDTINLITQQMDITDGVRLAASSREMYTRIGDSEGNHHWDEPCVLMPQFDDRSNEAGENSQHDAVYDVVPLDHSRHTAVQPFMHNRFWVGMNGDWIAASDDRGDWCLANICMRYSCNDWDHHVCFLTLKKIVICQVPTKAGHYADYKLIALFNRVPAYLEGGSQEWRLLDEADSPLSRDRDYYDAIELGGFIFAVDGVSASTYCWDAAHAGNLELPFIIPPPVVKDKRYSWFLARSADSKRLMIICTTDCIKVLCDERPPGVPYHGLNLQSYPPDASYVFEQDPCSAGPARVLVWRRVNSLGDHSLFLGLNYPIIHNLKESVYQACNGTLVPFMRRSCVYKACGRFKGFQCPKIVRYNLQADEDEFVGVISLSENFSMREAPMWFKPSLHIANSALRLKYF